MTSLPRRAARLGAGLGLAGAAALVGAAGFTICLIGAQRLVALRRQYVDADTAPAISGTFRAADGGGADGADGGGADGAGDGGPGSRPLLLAVLGDSLAAGLGVAVVADTVAGRLASSLAGAGRTVRLDGVAVAGARARDLGPQVSATLRRGTPDIAVILIGANDATHFTPLPAVERELGDAVRRLRAAGSAVIVGTCPDLGAARAFARPLRDVMAWSSGRTGRASVAAVRRAGGIPVDLAARTGAVFRADPGTSSEDCFHPSADGYGLWALALYPAVLDAAGAASEAGPPHRETGGNPTSR